MISCRGVINNFIKSFDLVKSLLTLMVVSSTFLAVPTAMAVNWSMLNATSDGSVKMFYDKDSFRKVNNEIQYWLKVSYSKPRQLVNGDSSRGTYNNVMYFVSLDCRNRLVKFSDMNFYLDSQKIHAEIGSKSGYQNIQPGSAPESDFVRFCK